MNNIETNVVYDANNPGQQNWKQWNLGAWVNSRTAWNPIITDPNYPTWNPGAKAPGIPGNANGNAYTHRRRYIMSLVNTDGDPYGIAPSDFISSGFQSGTWQATGNWNSRVIAKGDVMCAVSTENAPYHRIVANLQNGYCWTGNLRQGGAGRQWHDVGEYKG
jgi:hypothetical protein